MKIGIVLPYGVNRRGGVLEVVKAQHAELLRRGHDVHVVTPRPRDFDGEPDDHYLFVGNSIDFRALAQKTVTQVSLSLRKDIDTLLAREQFDVLHFHEPWVPLLGAQMLPRCATATVATFHANIPETTLAKTAGLLAASYTKPLIKYLDVLTATSDAAAEYTRSLTDRPIQLIPLGIDQTLYQPPKTFNDHRPHKTVLYVGRLEGRKGTKYLIEAFALLQARHPDTTLLIGSDGPDRLKLERLVAELELKNVKFLGYISTEDKVKHLQQCDLYCSPAIFGEGFGVVLLEAMAARTVTVAGDNPGYAGVMTGFGALSLVNPKDTPNFARRLELLLYEPKLRTLWRQWATSQLPTYTWSSMVDQYEAAYRQAIKQRLKK